MRVLRSSDRPRTTPSTKRVGDVADRRLPDCYLRLAPNGRILKAHSRVDLPWLVPERELVGLNYYDIIPTRELAEVARAQIALSRAYGVRVPMTYWWERDGVRVDRMAIYSARPNGEVEIFIRHLGMRAVIVAGGLHGRPTDLGPGDRSDPLPRDA